MKPNVTKKHVIKIPQPAYDVLKAHCDANHLKLPEFVGAMAVEAVKLELAKKVTKQ
jgi:hypothetical protein